MTSVFFQISRNDFLEASRTYSRNKEFALRIVSFNNGIENYVYLPEVSLNELSLLATILRVRLVPGYNDVNQLRKYIYGSSYYY